MLIYFSYKWRYIWYTLVHIYRWIKTSKTNIIKITSNKVQYIASSWSPSMISLKRQVLRKNIYYIVLFSTTVFAWRMWLYIRPRFELTCSNFNLKTFQILFSHVIRLTIAMDSVLIIFMLTISVSKHLTKIIFCSRIH